MQKLSIEVLERMLSADLTKKEVDFILYIAQFQDEFGKSEGIYYKDVCEAVDLSFQGFYDCRTSLEEKGIIKCEKCSYYDTDITILDNNFMGKENFGRGYVSLHCNMVRSEEFKKLPAGPKLMALILMRDWRIKKSKSYAKKNENELQNAEDEDNKKGSDSYCLKKQTFKEKFADTLHVTVRTARRYLGMLSPFLNIYLKDGEKYYLTFFKDAVEMNAGEESENGELRNHIIKIACRRNRIKNKDSKSVKDVENTLMRYNKTLRKTQTISLTKIVSKSLERINAAIKNKYRWERFLKPPLIHDLMIEEIQTAMI